MCARQQAEMETWEAIGWRVATEMGVVLDSSSLDDRLPPVETFLDKLNQHLRLYLALLIILLASLLSNPLTPLSILSLR